MANLFINTSIESDTEVPGIYANKNGGGYRVPINAVHLAGLSIPHSLSPAIGVRATTEALNAPVYLTPGGPSLRPYQRASLDHTMHKDGSAIWIPPGGGKTLCGLIWLAYEHRDFKLVVTKAHARKTWAEEVVKWTNWTPVILSGQTPFSLQQAHPDYSTKVFIVGWETLAFWKDELVKGAGSGRIASLVMDEIHVAKANKRADAIVDEEGKTKWEDRDNLTAAAAFLSKKSMRRLGLTGTPVPNLMKDLWAQLDLAEPWAWGGFKSFGMRYCDGHHNGYGMEYKGYSNGPELKGRLAFSAFRVAPKTVKASMPPKTRIITRVPLEDQDNPATGFGHSIRSASAIGDSDGLHEVLLQEAATRKRKIVIGIVLQALKSGQKVVIFTGRHKDCDVLGTSIEAGIKKLSWSGPKPDLWVSHGGHTIQSRDKIRLTVMGDPARGTSPHPGPCCLVGTGDAWGESVNLQDIDLAVFVQLPWTPRQLEQWEGRFQRLGGVRPVIIQYVVAEGTVDEDVADNLMGKLPPIEDVVTETGLAGIEVSFRPVPTGSLLSRVSGLLNPTTTEVE